MLMLEYAFILLFVALTLSLASQRSKTLTRDTADWWIDGVSLTIHLVGIPLLQTYGLLKIARALAPSWEGLFQAGPALSLGLYVLLDYVWYWNHRWMHSFTWIWNLHAVHHSAKQVDVFSTPRNSIWSHFFEIYIWFFAASIFLLQDASWFLGFSAVGTIMNFWSHTEFTVARNSRAYQWISSVFITPHEHLWHHSTDHANTNFSTTFSVWDRLHGTLYAPARLPASYGNEYLPGAFRQLVLPIAPVQGPAAETSAVPTENAFAT